MKNRPPSLSYSFSSPNYYAPLTGRVNKPEQHHEVLNSIVLRKGNKQRKQRISFKLASNHKDKNSALWRRKQSQQNNRIRAGVLDGSIPSAVSDTRATASAFTPDDPSIPTGVKSTSTFGGAFGNQAKATTINKLHHKLREPARSVHIVPQVQTSLLSTSKVVDADYIAVYDKHEVNFYDSKTTVITVSEEAVIKGWRCPNAGLWRVPLIEKPINLNTDTLLLNHPTKFQSKNQLYHVQTTERSCEHIHTMMDQSNKKECIHNVYELPSIEQTVRYLHAAAGHPVEETWLNSIGQETTTHGHSSTPRQCKFISQSQRKPNKGT